MPIRAIFFDIDDTLFPSAKFAAMARRKAATAMVRAGIRATKSDVLAAIESEVKIHGSNYEKHFDHVCSKFRCTNPAKAIAAGIVAYHNTKLGMRPYSDAARTLAALVKMGYPLYIASEGKPIKQWDKLIRLGLSQFFSDVFVTKRKSKAFYLSAAKRVRCKPSDCLMVGNRQDKDVAPAGGAGFQTAIFGGKSTCANYSLNRLSQLLEMLGQE